MKTSVHPQSRRQQGGSVRKKSAARALDRVLSSINDLVGQNIFLWGNHGWAGEEGGVGELGEDRELDGWGPMIEMGRLNMGFVNCSGWWSREVDLKLVRCLK